MTLCCMHNPGEQPQAFYEMHLPIGNTIPLCVNCCAWWRAEAVDDPSMQPDAIRSLPHDTPRG